MMFSTPRVRAHAADVAPAEVGDHAPVVGVGDRPHLQFVDDQVQAVAAVASTGERDDALVAVRPGGRARPARTAPPWGEGRCAACSCGSSCRPPRESKRMNGIVSGRMHRVQRTQVRLAVIEQLLLGVAESTSARHQVGGRGSAHSVRCDLAPGTGTSSTTPLRDLADVRAPDLLSGGSSRRRTPRLRADRRRRDCRCWRRAPACPGAGGRMAQATMPRHSPRARARRSRRRRLPPSRCHSAMAAMISVSISSSGRPGRAVSHSSSWLTMMPLWITQTSPRMTGWLSVDAVRDQPAVPE